MNNLFKYITFILLLQLVAIIGYSQTDCIVKLNEAERLYDEGKIERIPSLLNDCINDGFTKEEKITALRLLTIVYLFEDNQTKAEKSLLKLLKTEPEFQVNKSIDPFEFINLYNSYNTSPVFSAGLVFGLNNSFPRLIETYSINSFEDANPKYSPGGMGFAVGLKGTYHYNSLIDISIEPSYLNTRFTINEKVSQVNTTTLTEKLNYIEIPIYGSYNFYSLSNYTFYGELGFQYSKLLSSDIDAIIAFNNNEAANTEGPTIDSKAFRKDYNVMSSFGVGAKMNLKRSNLHFNIRYKIGYINVVNRDINIEDPGGLAFEYLYKDNDASLTNLSFTISYNREFYIHKKKPSNKSNYEIIK